MSYTINSCAKCNGTGKMLVKSTNIMSNDLVIVDCDVCSSYAKLVPTDPLDLQPYIVETYPKFPPCAFDGLPPGAYGLYCGCPRCSPTC